jgi:hypothetical protein
MSKSMKVTVYIAAVLVLNLASNAFASTFTVNGKPATKGEALIAKARDSKVKVLKIDEMEISDKGTLKAVKAPAK